MQDENDIRVVGQATGLSHKSILYDGLLELGLTENKNLFSQLLNYIEEIELFNPAINLVKVNDRNELIIKHILDSLAPYKTVDKLLAEIKDSPECQKIADAGSGAGLPGIPLALCMPSVEFTLIERMGKRAGFLLNCLASLSLKNVKIQEAEIEKLSPGSFDIVVFRAFRPLETDILKALFRLLKPHGFLAAWKGQLEKTREDIICAEKEYPGINWEIIPVKVPFLDEERCLLLIKNMC